MLYSLRVKNLAIIDEIEIDFSEGFNVITGETGSGKSIFLNALLYLLGQKSNPFEVIRHGEEFTEIEAILYLNNEETIVRRVISKTGKNKTYLNDRFISLKKLGEYLNKYIEFSAQNQNQILFNKEIQLELLDSFGKLDDLVAKYSSLYSEFEKIDRELKSLRKKREDNISKKELLQFHLELIEKLNIEDINEEEILLKKIEYAESKELIKENITTCYNEILSKENSLINRVSFIKDKISEIFEYKDSFKELLNLLEEVSVNLEEAGKLCMRELSAVSDEDANINMLYERMNYLKRLKKRLNKNSLSDILDYKKYIEKELSTIEGYSYQIEDLRDKRERVYNELNRFAKELSEKRKKIKEIFEREVLRHLEDLKISNVDFKVEILELDNLTNKGINEISFLISTNKGEPLKPLHKIASGGELSRIMLALKTILSDFLNIPVLIFDEIDSGTGGETSFAIGRKLKELSKKHQVLVITHLPQVAVFSENHYKIYKEVNNNRIVSRIKKLNYKERLDEIARMLSGERITAESIAAAKELLKQGL